MQLLLKNTLTQFRKTFFDVNIALYKESNTDYCAQCIAKIRLSEDSAKNIALLSEKGV